MTCVGIAVVVVVELPRMPEDDLGCVGARNSWCMCVVACGYGGLGGAGMG